MLTDVQIRKIKHTDKVTLYPDGNGLFLRVSKTKMRWQLSYMKDGKQSHFYAEAGYPEMGIAEARAWAAAKRLEGPKTTVAKSAGPTLGEYLAKYREKLQKGGSAPATLIKFDKRVNAHLKAHASLPVKNLDTSSLFNKVFKPIDQKNVPDALRQCISIVKHSLFQAVIEGVIPNNPCQDMAMAFAFPPETSRAALTNIDDFGQLLRDIDTVKGLPQVVTALKLSPYIPNRPGEIRFMEWAELDTKTKLWTIPGPKMKMGDDLIVSLPQQAWDLIQSMRPITGNNKYVFAMFLSDKPYSDATLCKALRSIGYYGAHQDKSTLPPDAKFQSPHGFRAIFRTICDEVLEWRVDILEQQLGHEVKDTNGRAYNRTKFLDQRVKMMQLWADFCDVLREGKKTKIQAFIKKNKGAI